MQLVAYGAQDIYLTGNPQITFFKVVYRRHTNFSMESIMQTFNGTLGSGARLTATISRNGDLIHKMYCEMTTNGTGTAIDNRGAVALKEIELEIGGQQIDKHYGHWLEVYAELTEPNHAGTVGTQNSTDGTKFQNMSCMGGVKASANATKAFVPLQFWFCRNPGLALPLIALQYHEVKVILTVSSETNANPSALDLWVDYIYLDTDERRRFAQVSHEYLIEQLQRQTESSAKGSYKLNFNHPVKEIIWTESTANIDQKVNLQLNGHDRFAKQDREYFQLRQPFEYHTAVPGFNIKETESVHFLPKPETLFKGDHNATAADGSCTLAATSVTFHANQAAGGTDPSQRCSVGDILFLQYDDAGSEASGNEDKYYYLQVTATSDTVITFTAFVDGVAAAITNNNNAAFGVTNGDNVSISRIAAVQNPTSKCSQLARNINVYSFALKPEEHQPSGTCNFSRIDNAKLVLNTAPGGSINIYAVNYNVLRVMSGMGGLAYSN